MITIQKLESSEYVQVSNKLIKININEFSYGMEVTQNGEFGVGIKAEPELPNMFGIIRRDNPIENDIEDCRGPYGTFIQIGCKVLEEDYSFQFINDDGSLKSSRK